MKNIFETDSDLLINPVNCRGVMGAGLAYQFKRYYPDMYTAYKEACSLNQIKIGNVWFDLRDKPFICCFPTKDDWKTPSNYKYIRESAKSLVNYLNTNTILIFGVETIAIPKLGCGLGGLEWSAVKSILDEEFAELIYPYRLIYCES